MWFFDIKLLGIGWEMSNGIRWNNWTLVQPVQFDYEKRATPRTVRLCGRAARTL
jgi:hypothetical protein